MYVYIYIYIYKKLLHQLGVAFRRVKNVWRKKTLEKSTMDIDIEVIPRLF